MLLQIWRQCQDVQEKNKFTIMMSNLARNVIKKIKILNEIVDLQQRGS